MTDDQIVLIGPLGVGKSTIAALLATTLKKPRCCFDELKLRYLEEAGLDLEKAHHIRDSEGMFAMWLYTNQFNIEAVERVIADYPEHIIDLAAGAHCFEGADEIKRAQKVFDKISQTVLLMPSPDLATSISALPGVRERRYLNTFFITHPLNEVFAKHTVYTYGKTPEQTASEVINAIQ